MTTPSREVIPSLYMPWLDRTVFCWRYPKTEVDDDFETLRPKIIKKINPCAYEAVHLSLSLILCFLGITDNEQEAWPHIALVCPDINHAKTSREKIISSGILKTVSTAFKLVIMPSTPYGTPIEVSPSIPNLSISLSHGSPPRRAGYWWILENMQSQDLEILYKPTKEPPKTGLEIFIRTPGKSLGRATGNIVIRRGKPGYLCLTTAHAFRAKYREEGLMNWGTDYRFTLEEPSATSRFGSLAIVGNTVLGLSNIISPLTAATHATIALVGSVFNRSLNSRANEWSKWGKVTDRPLNIPEEKLPRVAELQTLGHLKHFLPDCDWAMIEVTNENLIRALETQKDETSIMPVMNSDDSETFVTVYTYDGTVSGVLLPGSIYQKTPGGKTFKRVLLFQAILDDRESGNYNKRLLMSGLIRKGDCGSPVADSATGKCYGHIISVSEDGKTAFVMSASDAFEAMEMEAKMGPIIWSGLGPSSKRRECSIEEGRPNSAKPNIIATAEAWMARHNAILTNMKELHKISSDILDGTNRLKIAIVNFQEDTLFEDRYFKWLEMLSGLLREMAPYAIIGRSSPFFGTPTGRNELINIEESIENGLLSEEEYIRSLRSNVGQKTFGQQTLLKDDSNTDITVDEFEPDIIVMVRASKWDRLKRANLVIEYAEERGTLLLTAPWLKDPGPTSEVLEMIRVYSADGDGHRHSRYTGVEGHEHGIMTLGECVRSVDRPKIRRWRADSTVGRLMSGDSCAAVIAAGIAAMILQQTRSFLTKDEWHHLRRTGTMYALLRSMGKLDEGSKAYWIKHWEWFGPERVSSLDIEKEVKSLLQKNPPVPRPPAKD